MQKKKKKKQQQQQKMKVWNLESWLALCPTNYIFNILYYSFFPRQLVHSLFIFFFLFYFLIYTRLVTLLDFHSSQF